MIPVRLPTICAINAPTIQPGSRDQLLLAPCTTVVCNRAKELDGGEALELDGGLRNTLAAAAPRGRTPSSFCSDSRTTTSKSSAHDPARQPRSAPTRWRPCTAAVCNDAPEFDVGDAIELDGVDTHAHDLELDHVQEIELDAVDAPPPAPSSPGRSISTEATQRSSVPRRRSAEEGGRKNVSVTVSSFLVFIPSSPSLAVCSLQQLERTELCAPAFAAFLSSAFSFRFSTFH